MQFHKVSFLPPLSLDLPHLPTPSRGNQHHEFGANEIPLHTSFGNKFFLTCMRPLHIYIQKKQHGTVDSRPGSRGSNPSFEFQLCYLLLKRVSRLTPLCFSIPICIMEIMIVLISEFLVALK